MCASPLSFDDALLVLERLETVNSIVLVGGQALNYWCAKCASAELGEYGPFASKDIDFQGGRSAARECARLLKAFQATVDLPSDRARQNSGLVRYVDSEGVDREIDFLTSVYGLNSGEVLERSIPVYANKSSGQEISLRVMHPLHCMQSRVHNVIGLPDKYSNEQGLKQLRASIVCLREVIRQVAETDSRGALKLIERVFHFACDWPAEDLPTAHGICVFDAVPNSDYLPLEFRQIRYPQMLRVLGR